MKFSITIPAYKAKYLQECIKSILAQTYTDFELIIVNDASPEDLDNIVQKFTDSRIHYYTNEKNCGAIDVVDNWNICLSYAKGDYIICMGDDDVLDVECLEEYNRLINKYPDIDLFHSRVKQINEKGEFIKLTDARPEWESVLSMIWHRMIYRQQYIGDYLFKTQTLKAKGGFYKLPYAWASDDITTYIIAKEKGVVHTDKPMFYYRVNSQTITQSGNPNIKMDALMKTDRWYYEFVEEYIPNNIIDEYLKKMISAGLKKYSMLQKSKIIAGSLNGNTSLLFWIKVREKYAISFKLLIFSVIEYIKSKHR